MGELSLAALTSCLDGRAARELTLTLDGRGELPAPQSEVTAKRELAPYIEKLIPPLTKQRGELAWMV